MSDTPKPDPLGPIPIERIHELGAIRHHRLWWESNRRAVEKLWGSGLRADDPKVKDAVPRIVLAVLDGVMVDQGLTFDPEKGWVSK
jgi:hypothetical protein